MRRRDCAAGLLSLGFAGLAAAPARADARTIKIATIGMANSPWDMALRRFKQVVETESGGRYAVNVYTDGSLGDIAQLLSAMQLGTVEFSAFGLTSITLVRGGEPLNVAYTPYLFPSAAAAERVLNNDEFRAIYEKIGQSAGVHVFGAWGQRSPRALQTVPGPISTPDQVKGLRLRIPAIPMLKAVFERFGAQITPLGMLEIYNALSRGTIDGQDNGFDLSIPAHYQDVAKHWSATNHAFELVGFFASERFWRSLPAADRGLFEHASKEAGTVVTELTRSLDTDAIGILKASGCTYTVPDRAAFKAALAGVETPFDGKLWPAGLVERIRTSPENT
ncbi:MAG: TRAP transporter substrate-binding protein [Janthinobacterium lividum]